MAQTDKTDTGTADSAHKTVEVRHDILLQAVGALKLDSKRGYKGNATTYADFRHGTARTLAESLEKEWSDIADARTGHDVDYITDD